MNLMVKLTVVIVNWNGGKFIKECLSSIQAQTFRSFDIVVVDNGSSDGSYQMLQSYDDIDLIRLPHNTGFAHGNNVGFDHCDGDAAVIVNVDTVARRSWLKELYERFSTSGGMVTSRILGPSGELESIGISAALDGSTVLEKTRKPMMPSGAAALYPMDMIRETEGFDEMFFSYAEDLDLGLRGILSGWSCTASSATIMHYHSGTSASVPIYQGFGKRYLVERNRLFLFGKYASSSVLVSAMPWVLWKEMMTGIGAVYFGKVLEYLHARKDTMQMWDTIRQKHKDLLDRYGKEKMTAIWKDFRRPMGALDLLMTRK